MKKIFLIFALTALMSIGANASVEINAKQNNDVQQQGGSVPSAPESSTDISIEHPSEFYNKLVDSFLEIDAGSLADSFIAVFDMEVDAGSLADSFVAAFGMEVDAGDSGDAAPGMGEGSSEGTMAAGMSGISTTSVNQVTLPFTPYSD